MDHNGPTDWETWSANRMSNLLDDLAVQVKAYRAWMDANTDDQGNPLNMDNYSAMADFDEERMDWWEALSQSAIDVADEYEREENKQ